MANLERSVEERVQALEEQVARLTPAQGQEVADAMTAWMPPPKPERSMEERVAALERELLPE